ncbi:hypothetical protein KSP40_PGU000554 [Platanthera guangdongensis]|uniref:Oleosin n=1 Tax=Platanthera guangdongensis TaxID=2320717 RepID=A0ABR2LYW3_9ASPA
MAEVYASSSDNHHRRLLIPANYAGSGTLSALTVAVTSLAIGGPLLGLTAFSLVTTTAFLAVTTPLLLLFSPVIVPAALVIVAAMACFGFSALLAISGMMAVVYAFRSVLGMLPEEVGRKIKNVVMGKREEVKEKGLDIGGYLEDKGRAYMPEGRLNKAA